MAEENMSLTELTATVVGAFVGHNAVAVADLPALITATYAALAGVDSDGVVEATDDIQKPTAGQIRKSITPDGLVSFLDGKSYKTLKRHLGTHGLTVEEYKARFGLPATYPSVAPNYSAARSALAKSLGLGQGGRGAKGKPAVPPPKTRAKKST
jgi:predicted transcriptional regulator